MNLIHLPKNARALVSRTQDAIEQSVQIKTDSELAQPSRFWLKATTWSLMGTTILGIGWLAIAQTEEIVVAPGKLEPLGDVKPIQVPMGGVVEAILVKEGEKVTAGQQLLRMDTEATEQKQQSLKEAVTLKQEQLNLKLEEKQIVLAQIEAELGVLRRNLLLQQDVADRVRSLWEAGAGSEIQMLQQNDKIQQVEGELERLEGERLKQNKQMDQQIRQLRSELAQLRSNFVEQTVSMRYKSITSPVDGIIFELKPKSPGFVAQNSEPVMTVVPFDKLQASVEIPSSDIGFVKIGQKADISIDSFPATDFGVLEGRVESIGSDALPPDAQKGRSTYSFASNIKLPSQKLKLSNGEALPLQVGMSLTANIKLRKVSYLQLLLGSFKDKTSSLQEF
tara:strand:+ start:5751 stop:6929 length:1179 start_codon:yes stop_codon:yes gene_type:complete